MYPLARFSGSLAALVLVAGTLASGCDRPVVDLAPPQVEVVSPADLSVVQTEPFLDLALRAEVFGTIDSLAVNGETAAFDASTSVYQISVSLTAGINVLPVDVFDADGLRGSDTLYVLRSDLRPVSVSVAGSDVARAGAAASLLPSGDVLISGGTGLSGQALASATRISGSGPVIGFSPVELAEARTGHTSSTLPDGRVLLLGGARDDASRELTGTAERVDLDSGTSETVLVATESGIGVPVARSGHATRLLDLDGILVLSLYGGVDGVGAPLSTVDVFRLDTDRLIRLSPGGGVSGGFPAYARPTQAPIGTRGMSDGSAVVFGLPSDVSAETAHVFDWLPPRDTRFPFTLVGSPIEPLSIPRESAAAVFGSGIVLVSGGTAADGTTLDTFEAFVPSVNRTFRFPDSIRLRTPRADHTATLLPGGRILIAGGRNASGSALSSLEVFQL